MTHRHWLSRTLLFLPAILLAMGMVGCPKKDKEGFRIDIRGLGPDEAAAHIADQMCQYMQVCGMVMYECEGSSGGDTMCTGTIEYPPYGYCHAELSTDIRDDLFCEPLSPTEEVNVNDCINAMLAEPCLTQAQVDANAAAMAAGEDFPYGGTVPAACYMLGAIIDNCEDYVDLD